MVVAALERRFLRGGIRSQDQHTRKLLDRWGSTVVEERDRSVGMASCVVLPRKSRPGPHPEVALLAAEPPDDLLRLVVDLIDGVRVASGDEQVAARLDVDGVDVEVVVGSRLRAGFGLWRGRIGLRERNLGIAMAFAGDPPAG